jgi:hypothetical protein
MESLIRVSLISVSINLGRENVSVIVDPDPFVMQVGYGTEQALRRLHDKGIPVRVQKGLRIGIVIADDFAAVFAPPALNVVFPSAGIPNAICLSAEEAGRLLRAVATDNQGNSTPEGLGDFAVEDDEQEDNVPRIATLGEALLEQSDLAKIRETLVRHPPVSPDLDRQMRIINSTFQVVKVTLNGVKLSQRKLPLRAEELGIEDADLQRRIGASFKLFETDVDSLTRGFQDDLDEIKRKRLSNTPVRGAGPVLKCPDERRTKEFGNQATYARGSSAVSGGVCEQRYAAERVLPQPGFELRHTRSASEETAVEGKKEKRSCGRPIGTSGISHQEIGGGARVDLPAGRCVIGRSTDRSAS